MKVFYVCRTGHHTSLLAAALHLGILTGKPGDARNIYSLPGFDNNSLNEIGKPFSVRRDDNSTEVYTFGVSKENRLMIRAASELISLIGINPGEWHIIDTSHITSKWTIAGTTVKRVRLHTLSKVFLYLGARKELTRLQNILNVNNENTNNH